MKTDKIYYYEIGWGSHEESRYITLTNKAKYTKPQLNKIMQKAFKNLLDKGCLDNKYRISFADINFSIIDELILSFNFKKLEYQSTYRVFGSPNILDPEDWKGDRDKELDQLYNTAKKRLEHTEKLLNKRITNEKNRKQNTKIEEIKEQIRKTKKEIEKNKERQSDDITFERKRTALYTNIPNQIIKTLKKRIKKKYSN